MSTILVAMICFIFHDLPVDHIEGRVTAVRAGDILEVTTHDGDLYPIVLKGIDCPELKQEFGPEAKQFAEELVYQRNVVVYIDGKDRFKNYVGVVIVEENVDIRVLLLEEGLAWTTEKGPDADLEALRVQAVSRQKGLWKLDNPTPPWVFRRQQSLLEAKSR
jgi:endonuclease YncB( thermonuclease family)